MSPGAAALAVIVTASLLVGFTVGTWVAHGITLRLLATPKGIESLFRSVAHVVAKNRARGEAVQIRCPCGGKGFL